MAFECMDDCIHLKACRRLQKIGRSKGHTFGRNCTEDCSAYVSGNTGSYISSRSAAEIARYQYDGDHDPYDIYAEHDFCGKSLQEIIDELEE